MYKGKYVQSMHIVKGQPKPNEIKERFERERRLVGKTRAVKLSKFLQETAFVISSVKINRAEVIKYVANVLGGVHHDAKRKGTPLGRKYALMDSVRKGELQVAGKDTIYYELLSIGQRLVKSQDVQKLMRHIKQYFQQC